MASIGMPATESARGVGRVATAAEVAAKKTSGSAPAFVTPENMTEGVKLNNTVTSTSATEAATANAVKMAYDKATSAQNTADSAYNTAYYAAPRPQSYSGAGQWTYIANNVYDGSNVRLTLPYGGTWAYVWFFWSQPGTSRPVFMSMGAGVASGGTTLSSNSGGYGMGAICWRVA